MPTATRMKPGACRLPCLSLLASVLFACGTPAASDVESGLDGWHSNAAPSAPEVSIAPLLPTTFDDLAVEIHVESIDPDGDSVSYIYRWFRDGSVVINLTEAVVPADKTERGEVWHVVVTPYDGFVEGPSITSPEVMVQNVVPVVDAVTVEPGVATTNTLLIASATTSDADNDPLTVEYQWFVDDTEVPGATGSILDGAESFDRDQKVFVRAWASDGTDTGAPLDSASITIGNTAPTAPVVSVFPAAPVPGDSIVCLVDTTGMDVDGDALSVRFEWWVDDAPYGGETSTTENAGDTVVGREVGSEEVWRCEAVMDDGDLDSPIASDQVTVSVCDPDLLPTCEEGGVRFCAADGGRFEVIDCGDPGCEAGACREPICEPSSTRCEGNTLYTCASHGMGELGADCGPDSYCDEVAKACVDYDCAVGEKRCDGDRLEVCAADRLGYELVEDCDETVAVDTPLACGMHTSSGEMACVSPVGGACLWYEVVTGDEILYRCSGDDPLCSGGSTTEQDFRCVDAGFTCADGDRGTCVGDFLVGDCFHGQPLGWDCASFGGECADGGGSATCIGLPEREACGTVTAGEMRCAEGLACVEGVCRDVAEYICRDGVLRERGGQRYVFCVHAVSLAEAEASCAREGMQLASHNDAVENAWIMTTAVNVGLTTLGAEWMWLGMNDIEVEGEWMWADGSPVTTFLWSYRQPDVPTLEQDCGAVNLTTQRWNDAWCDDPRSGPYPFACEGAAL